MMSRSHIVDTALGLGLAFLLGAALLPGCQSPGGPTPPGGDDQAPTVSETLPLADASGVATNATVTVLFSEPVNPGTVGPENFRVSVLDQVVRGSIVSDSQARRFSFVPDDGFPGNRDVDVDVTGVVDPAGNMLPAPYHFVFHTGGSPNQPPAAPCSPSPNADAVNVSVNVQLSWGCTTDPDGDTVEYDVHLGTDSNPAFAATVSAPPYVPPTPLAAGTRYYWRIDARDEHGAVTPSPVWHFDTGSLTPPNQPPAAPAEPISPANGSTTLGVTAILTWSGGADPDGDPVNYLVRFGTANPPPNLRTVSARTTTVLTPLLSQTYYWQIVSRDDHSHETAGPIWSFNTPGPPNQAPSAPCLQTPADNADHVSVTTSLTWGCGVDPESDPVTFVVYLERNGGQNPDSVATTTATSYTPSDSLRYGSFYSWKIVARDDHGNRTSSPVRGFDTENANRPPTAPCNPNPYDGATDISPDDVRLRWGCGQDPDDDPESYDVYFGTTPEPTFIDTNSTRNYFVGGVEPNTQYYWKIVAKDNRGGETAGPVWSFKTKN
jgi:hypothetical protein